MIAMLFCGTCFAEHWEPIDGEKYSLDIDSVKTLQIDYDTVVKVKVKYPASDGNGIGQDTLFINKDNSRYFVSLMEHYDRNSSLIFKFSDDPRKLGLWTDGTNTTWIQKILKRTN